MRRFELEEGTSSKFWEVATRGATLVVRFGRIGTEGQARERKLASATAAETEAEKLVREKRSKGYREVSGGKAAKPAKAARPAKSARPAKTAKAAKAAKPAKPQSQAARIMPVPGLADPRTGKFAFTAELDRLFARGWPELRVLSDEAVTPAVARKEAIAALTAIDPYLPTVVPREIARRMLIGYMHPPFDDAAGMRAAVDGDRQVDASLLDEVLRRGIPKETYVFRMKEVVFLLEAFLGTEVVAAAVVERCRDALENRKVWGAYEDPKGEMGRSFWVDHHNACWRRLVHALGWLRLRMKPARWKEIVAPLRKRNPKLPRYSETLARLVDDSIPVGDDEYSLGLAAQRRERAAIRAHYARWPRSMIRAEHVYAAGAGLLLEIDVKALPRDAKWFQQRTVAEIGAIRAPGTVRVMAALLASRSAGAHASAWLEQHREWVVGEALPALAKRAADAEHVRAVQASLSGAAAPPKSSPRALERERAQVIALVPAALHACKGDPKRELAVFSTAFARWCEIQAALGAVIPEAYFTHAFIDAKWGKADRATTQRWMSLAIQAASA
jgi:predicted DNA-binding WGR domain protein